MMKQSLFALILIFAVAGPACYRPAETNTRRVIAPAPAVSSTPDRSERDNHDKAMGNENVNSKQPEPAGFNAAVPSGFVLPAEGVGRRILEEYGSLFVAAPPVRVPASVMFRDEADAAAFQSSLETGSESFGGITVVLQAPALKALREAAAEAGASGLKITPRAADSAKRTYPETVDLWRSRIDPGLTHWAAQRRITPDEASRIRALAPAEQVAEILRLEERGIFFSKDLSKSVLYSVAPPGASQHLSLLALDVREFDDPKVREILARHGWFRTVKSDLPHFTFLGLAEADLPARGLKRVLSDGQVFWVPDLR